MQLCLLRVGQFIIALTLFAFVSECENESQAQETRPNVILMMADDMGWGDVSFSVRLGEDLSGTDINYGGTPHWSMPHLETMASNGLKFSRMYSQHTVCSPTRASVLTGRAPQRQSITFANTGKMQNREITVGEYAKSLGYTTGLFGKWHLGSLTRDVSDANRGGPGSFSVYSTPLNNGFDVEYVTESKVSTYNPTTSGMTTTTRYWTGPGQSVPLNSPNMQGDDSAIIARETNDFITNAVNDSQPFLAIVWFHTPHKPVNDPNGNRDNIAAYTYAMQDLDSAIGQIRTHVESLGIANDTILMFTSDNGAEDGQNYNPAGLRNNKRELHEGGVRVPGIIEWPNTISAGTTHTPMVTSDYLPTLLDIWEIEPVDSRPIDGVSMANTIFLDRDATRDQSIVFKSTNGHQSVIGVDGRYKLISTNNGDNWELYDLVLDFGEQNAVANSASIGSADVATQTIFNSLLNDYSLWETSVAASSQSEFTGDYSNRVASNFGGTVSVEPPENLGNGNVATGGTPILYLERQHATLRADVEVNSLGEEGTYSIGDSGMLGEGLVVNSYLMHFNPTSSNQVNATAKFTFEDKIAGVIGGYDLLVATDELSYADPNFESSLNRRMDTADGWEILDDGYTIEFDLRATNFVDEARILTASSLNQVPDPITIETVIGDGVVQRSMVTSVNVMFSAAVSIGPEAFELEKRGTDGGDVELSSAIDNSGQGPSVVLTFSGPFAEASGSLIDGNYQLTVHGDQITDGQGVALDVDGDGNPGGVLVIGDEESEAFFRLFGDSDQNRIVNVVDLLGFRQAYQLMSGDASFDASFDSNVDETIDIFDLLRFRQNYLETMPFNEPPPPRSFRKTPVRSK
ncbi:sulfatase-like hydrolase/transferase [Mariniblastus fucicola]|uniref:Arylsulfatase n=2 Tax=Mariniblastus fucicola TaxID=980251 RepID=A0A5B9PBV1_9BACT|nr:sulfatase-like hydrolase/transferase [Mariniblastus fucicola]QEG22959.1 Arylsulfatase precursor [Mariniblastus fucicola]